MPKPIGPKFPKELADALVAAEALAANESLQAAFHAAADESGLRALALRDPAKFLAQRKIEIPKSIGVQFVEVEIPGRPYPIDEFFTIVLSKCRTYWVREKDEDGKLGRWTQVTVCFALEIFPKRWPPIAGA